MQDLQSAPDIGTRQTLGELNEILRRFLQYKGEAEWVSIVLDGSVKFAAPVALFAIRGGQMELRGARGLDLPSNLTMETGDAAAFANAVQSTDVVVTLRTVQEVGRALAEDSQAGRAYLFPIANGARVAALLFAADSTGVDMRGADMRGVELICGMAALVLQRQANAESALQIAVPVKELSFSVKPGRKLPPFADLSDKERSVHLRAQRLARVKVAEIQLAHPEAARTGREQNNVYLFLKNEINAARESYQNQFGEQRRMDDYLHLELVRTLVDGDEEKLGEEYPGRLD